MRARILSIGYSTTPRRGVVMLWHAVRCFLTDSMYIGSSISPFRRGMSRRELSSGHEPISRIELRGLRVGSGGGLTFGNRREAKWGSSIGD